MEKRKRRVCKTPGHRYCNVCEGEFPISTDYFVKDSSRPGGCGYECKLCHAERKKLRDRSKELVANLTPEQLNGRRSTALRYARQQHIQERERLRYHVEGGRATKLTRQYRLYDEQKSLENDIDAEWFSNNISGRVCVYCDDPEQPVGCDRIDNTKGHLRANVVPSCGDCNKMRADRFSYEEMKLIGALVKQIKLDRHG